MSKHILLSLVLLFSSLSFGANTDKLAALPHLIDKVPSDARWDVQYNIQQDIDLAKKLLTKQEAGFWFRKEVKEVPVFDKKGRPKFNKQGKRVMKKEMTRRLEFNILLAVEHISDRKIKIVKISRGGDNTKGYEVDWNKINGVNTDFSVTHPEGHIVLAIKRVVRSPGGYEEVIYTPYTDDLDTPGMRSRGMTYLNARLTVASRLLAEQLVHSKAYPGMLVSRVVPEDVAFVLSIIEHIDPSRLRNEAIESLVKEVLVTVAANREYAYRYAVSKAGARDLFQFIPRTYYSIRAQYPRADLNQNFVLGMRDHVNGAKASLLLFDSDLSRLPSEYREQALKSKVFLADYLAAAYNCGAPNTARALKWGKNWKEHLPKETRLYLVKLHEAQRVLGLKWL